MPPRRGSPAASSDSDPGSGPRRRGADGTHGTHGAHGIDGTDGAEARRSRGATRHGRSEGR